jgi:3-deoxy-D-manno-octulosonate 8-phosphate phosphatase (KDO 8-P phosphatase)
MVSPLSHIRALICDVDGSLCSPHLWYGNELPAERAPAQSEAGKFFHVRDGHRIVNALAAGLRVGVCTGRDSAPLRRRAQDLRLDPLLFSVPDKVVAIAEWGQSVDLGLDEVAFFGDDYPDFCLLGQVGLFISPADADPSLLRRADWVTKAASGNGAVAEIIEAILKAQNRWAPGGTQV